MPTDARYLLGMSQPSSESQLTLMYSAHQIASELTAHDVVECLKSVQNMQALPAE